jgi:hypothetical protein
VFGNPFALGKFAGRNCLQSPAGAVRWLMTESANLIGSRNPFPFLGPTSSKPEVHFMLYISLVLSAGLLLIACWAVCRSRQPIWNTFFSALVFALAPQFLMLFLPVVMMHALVLLAVAVVCSVPRRRPRLFLPLACAATLAVYGIAGWFALQEVGQMREQFPYVSMEERLPPPKYRMPGGSLAEAAAKHLTALEEIIADQTPHVHRLRIMHLQELHEKTVQVFINRPGFGVTRLSAISEEDLKQGLREDPPLPQPGPASTSAWSTATLQKVQPVQDGTGFEEQLWSMHQLGVSDFVNSEGFGFFKDRRHVAGFQEHRFSQVPKPAPRWALQTLDLVGLVVHDEPVAYMSAHLPRMDELRGAPTRPLDTFEALGLKPLRCGEDLFVRDTGEVRRVLGAVRSVRQCVSCHGGERGDLLGAFSYTLAQKHQKNGR